MIISGHIHVANESKASRLQIRIYDDKLIPGLKEMTDAVHEYDGKIITQLADAGTFALDELIEETPYAVSLFDELSESPRKRIT